RLTSNSAIDTNSVVTINGGTLDVTTISNPIFGLTLISGSIIGSTGFLSDGNSYDVQSGTVSAILAGSSTAFNKTTTGTVTLSGANTWTGTTTVNAGVLNLQNGAALGTGGTTVAAGAALQLQGNITVDSEPLTLSGSGVV